MIRPFIKVLVVGDVNCVLFLIVSFKESSSDVFKWELTSLWIELLSIGLIDESVALISAAWIELTETNIKIKHKINLFF